MPTYTLSCRRSSTCATHSYLHFLNCYVNKRFVDHYLFQALRWECHSTPIGLICMMASRIWKMNESSWRNYPDIAKWWVWFAEWVAAKCIAETNQRGFLYYAYWLFFWVDPLIEPFKILLLGYAWTHSRYLDSDNWALPYRWNFGLFTPSIKFCFCVPYLMILKETGW